MAEIMAEENLFIVEKNMLQKTAVMLGTFQSERVFFLNMLGVLSAENQIIEPLNAEVDCLVSVVMGDIMYLFAWRIFQMLRNCNRSNLTSRTLCVAQHFFAKCQCTIMGGKHSILE